MVIRKRKPEAGNGGKSRFTSGGDSSRPTGRDTYKKRATEKTERGSEGARKQPGTKDRVFDKRKREDSSAKNRNPRFNKGKEPRKYTKDKSRDLRSKSTERRPAQGRNTPAGYEDKKIYTRRPSGGEARQEKWSKNRPPSRGKSRPGSDEIKDSRQRITTYSPKTDGLREREPRVPERGKRPEVRPDKREERSHGISGTRSYNPGARENSKGRFKKPQKENRSVKGNRPARQEMRTEPTTTDTRLNKYISNAGISSRREADNLIGAGLVSVNGKVITEMGYQVKPGDIVRYNGTKLNPDTKVYLMMNKPKDMITTLDDPDGRRIVTDILKGEDLPRVYPVGRLDRNTTGVLILTNDGELAQRLMHPKYEVQKIYKATLDKNFKGEDLWTLSNGIELEDGFIKPDSIAIPDPASKNDVAIEIHSGRNRIVHRMFEHLGYSLDKLDRLWYAGLNKKSLKRGEWKHLEERELKTLKKLVKMK